MMRVPRVPAILSVPVLVLAVSAFAFTHTEARAGASAAATIQTSKKTVNLLVSLCAAGNTYCDANLAGAKEAARKMGNVKITVFDPQFDPHKQANELRDALVSNKFNAWLLNAND